MTSLSTHGVYTPQHLPANRSNIPHPLFYVLQNCIGLTCLQTSDIPHPLFCVLQNCISLTCLQTGATFHTPYSTFYKIVLFLLACKQEQHSTPLVLCFTKLYYFYLPANRSNIPHPLLYILQNFIIFTCLQTGATFHTPCSVFYKIVLFLLACKQERHSTPLTLRLTKLYHCYNVTARKNLLLLWLL